MKKVVLKPNGISLKLLGFAVAAMIVLSSVAIMELNIKTDLENDVEPSFVNQQFQSRPFEARSILSEGGLWVSFDSAAPGTSADVHVTVSDTSGITIVADFHGFWRNNYTYNSTHYYDDLDMPGASPIQDSGKPMIPILFEFIEIPHDVNIAIVVLASSYDNISGYNVRPAPPPDVPVLPNDTFSTPPSYNISQTPPDPVYSVDALFPGTTTRMKGETNTTTWMMRGHRLMGLSLYPVQYNPVNGSLRVYSQMIIKLKYDIPAQIEPVPEALLASVFDTILARTVLNYGPCRPISPVVGTQINGKIPDIVYNGAEYLIITTEEYEHQADRLAEWKHRKGVRAKVETVAKGSKSQVEDIIDVAYTTWFPVPTYVLLLGDVEDIPANYEAIHWDGEFVTWHDGSFSGYIASDLGYFNIEGAGYLPEMIYGRMSVDTVEQAENMVDKTLQYEIEPTYNSDFYNNMLFSGYFNDRLGRTSEAGKDGVEDKTYPFTFMLELIRHHLKDRYNIHVNYSSTYMHYDYPGHDYPGYDIPLEDLKFDDQIYHEVNGIPVNSYLVSDSIDSYFPNFGWIGSYDYPVWYDLSIANITPGINDGRFLVLYNGHGGSFNMIRYNKNNLLNPLDNEFVRDHVEGWDAPYYNASSLSYLTNGDMTPLVINMACSTGWYDGEDDEEHLYLGDDWGSQTGDNLFEDFAAESFAEEITRMEGGAIAAIAASRPAYSIANRHLMESLIQAFWPGYLELSNQPIYGMGAALVFAKFRAVKELQDDAFLGIVGYPYKDETVFHEYHLFGDPETQLWTENPSNFTVTYPLSVGTSDSQRFVVNVHNRESGAPVNFAKVCIQQEEQIYVGYTDGRGQVIFDVTPLDIPNHLNVTVTKHNFRPHLGNMRVHEDDAKVLLWPSFANENEQVNVSQTGFPESNSVVIYFDGVPVDTLDPGMTWKFVDVPPGDSRYINVWLAKPGQILLKPAWNPVSVNCFGRVSEDAGPDPYIYSQDDRSTWDVTEGVVSWDNPDIEIVDNIVYVTVHNRGASTTIATDVTLSYAPYGGGLSWHVIDEKPVPNGAGTVSFTFAPLPQSVGLRVDLFHKDESLEDTTDNTGYEVNDAIQMTSPGTGYFEVGNPTCSEKYVSIRVKQLNTSGGVWNASIQDYSHQMIKSTMSEPVTLFIDSLYDLEDGEFRGFEVEIFVYCLRVGGFILNATEGESPLPPIDVITIVFILGIGVGIVIATVIFLGRERRK